MQTNKYTWGLWDIGIMILAIVLVIVRIFHHGMWVNTLPYMGLTASLANLSASLQRAGRSLDRGKRNFCVCVLLICVVMTLISLILTLLSFASPPWTMIYFLHDPVQKDVATIIALLLCIRHNFFVSFVTGNIKKSITIGGQNG